MSLQSLDSSILLASSALGLLRLIHLRSLPFLGWLLLAPGQRGLTRVKAGCAMIACALSCQRAGVLWELLAWDAAAQLYIAMCCFAVLRLAPRQRRAPSTRVALFVLLAVAFLLVPGVLLSAARNPIFLLLGWETMLAAYSYLIDGPRVPNAADDLFFLLVNPTLVYAERGARVRAPGFDARGVQRIALGIGVSWLAILLGFVAFPTEGALFSALPGYPLFLAQGVLFFVARYSALSSLASGQLGAMRLLGWEIPERYDRPFLARSPSDFWRRWNSYVTGWFQRYVFIPLAFYGARRWAVDRRVATPLAAMATLVLVGLYHDIFHYLGALDWRSNASAGFTVAALCIPLWPLATASATRLGRLWAGPLPRSWPGAATLVARGALLHIACTVAWAMLHWV
jgi:hypothetical protein